MTEQFTKDPQAVLDYQINWATWLGSDSISTSTWTVPAGITKDSDTNTTTTTTIWLSGGTAGTTYALVNRITTAGGRTQDQTLTIAVANDDTAYCTVAEVKTQRGLTGTTDDALLAKLIAAVTARIDLLAGRTFSAAADTTRYFDCLSPTVDGAVLYFDTDCCALTTVTNGDATTVAAASYVTRPRNGTPYYAIELKGSTGLTWTYSTDAEKAISVAGRWAYSTTAPTIVTQLTIDATIMLYDRRTNPAGETTVLEGNTVVVPKDVTAFLKKELQEAGLIRLV